MKALVTGANGFLGSWVVRGLLNKGIAVRIIHRPQSDLSSLKSLDVESFLGDITDLESLYKATEKIDYVFHVAGLVSYNHREREKMYKVNVLGTKNVIDACIKNNVSKLIHTSSVVTIGASAKPEVLNEQSPYNLSLFNLGYFETKREAEKLVLQAAQENKLHAVVVNPSSMFGPGDATKPTRKKYFRVALGKFPYSPPGGMNIVDVEDAVQGHFAAMQKGKSGQRYILGAENITVKKLFELFAKAGGAKPPPYQVPSILLKAMYYYGKTLNQCHLPVRFSYESMMIGSLFHWFDHTKAKKELGFNPRPAEQAIERSVEWAKENGYFKE